MAVAAETRRPGPPQPKWSRTTVSALSQRMERRAASKSSRSRLYGSAAAARNLLGGRMVFSAATCAGRAWIAAGTSFSTSRRSFSALASPSQASPNSHRRGPPDSTESPMASGFSQSICQLVLPAGQTSNQLAGNFHALGPRRGKIDDHGQVAVGRGLLSKHSIGRLANSASPPRATNCRKASSLPVTIVWASTASSGCGQGPPRNRRATRFAPRSMLSPAGNCWPASMPSSNSRTTTQRRSAVGQIRRGPRQAADLLLSEVKTEQ